MLAPVTEVHYGEEALLALTLAAPRPVADLRRRARGRQWHRSRLSHRRHRVRGARQRRPGPTGRLAVFQGKLGLEVTRLRSREVRRLSPRSHRGYAGGFLVTGDHSVDNRALVRGLREACLRAGVACAASRSRELAELDAGTVSSPPAHASSAAASRAAAAAGQGPAAASVAGRRS